MICDLWKEEVEQTLTTLKEAVAFDEMTPEEQTAIRKELIDVARRTALEKLPVFTRIQ